MEQFDLDNYERFLGRCDKKSSHHWDKMEKRTATLFQVLIDGDLRELVFVLRHYPEYIEIVCEHFRYLYNYSEQVGDIYAASELLSMSESYHQKQFVRNLVRKLERLDELNISDFKSFLNRLVENQPKIHPIILSYYKLEAKRKVLNSDYHKLQIKVIQKLIDKLEDRSDFDFRASDRDATLDIPYMD